MSRENREGGAKKPNRKVVLLKDLAPRKDVRGGSGKLLFGGPTGGRGTKAPKPP
jgi:hypothetical protein